jgi:hypothetical protein
MTRQPAASSPQVLARLAGALYLIIIVFGIAAEVLVRSSLIVPGDAAATANNILASESLFRMGFVGDSIVFLSDVALAVLLYVLLAPVNKTLALIAAGFRLTQTAVLAVNLLHHYAALLLLTGSEYRSAFDAQQLNALVLLVLDIHGHGYDLGLVFFGVSCVVLGYLIAKSGYLPRLLGILVMFAGAAYLVGSYTLFLFPAEAVAIEPIYFVPLVAEVSLCLWLLVQGIDVEQWNTRRSYVA